MGFTTALTVLVTLTFATELTLVEGEKILVIPGPMVSHCLESMAVGRELLNRGHHVTLFAHLFDPTSCMSQYGIDENTPKFKVVSTTLDPEIVRKHKSYFDALEKGLSIFQIMSTVANPLRTNLCSSAFSDQMVIKKLEDDNYDIALVDGVVIMNCLASIAVHLDVPYASIGSYLDWYTSGTPLQFSTLPIRLRYSSNVMTFGERLLNTLMHILSPLFMMILFPSLDMTPYSDRLRGVDTTGLIKDSVLFLENSDYVLDNAKAVFPNFVQVGALTAGPAKVLPTELKSYMDNSKHGVILVTFGSVLKNIDARVLENVLTAMYRFEQNVILMYTSDGVRNNVRTMKWVPQNDVLGHNSVRLFVSHCGKNSIWESIYHGVPIICVPFATDGYSNSYKVEYYNIGSSLNILEANAEEIYETVREVMQNDTVRSNIKKMSTILRDRFETSPQRAASALEHVIKYGGSQMRPPSVDFIPRIYLDVWLPIYIAAVFIIVFDVWLCKICCCRGRIDSKKK